MPSTDNLLASAHLAADRGDWEEVSNYLLAIDPALHEPEIIDLSLRVLTQGDFQDSWQVAKVLPKLGDAVIQPLLAILQNADLEPAAYWFAGRILGGSTSPTVVEAMIDRLSQNPPPEIAEILLQVLTDMGTPAIQRLNELLEVPARRLAAVTALAQIRHSQTIEPLLSVVADPDPIVREQAIEALSSFHDARIPPLLITALTDSASPVRRVAVIGLGMRPELAVDLQLVDRLQPLLLDLSLDVCMATAAAMGRLGNEAAAHALWHCYQQNTCPVDLGRQIGRALGGIDQELTVGYLQQILWSGDLETALVALRALDSSACAIGDRLQDQQSLVAKILGDYLQNPPANDAARIRQEIAAVLGNMPNSLAVEKIGLLLADPDDRVRWQAIYCLKQRGDKVLELLEQLAQSTDTPVVVTAAIRQYLTECQADSMVPES
jgi:HEAT repeat protein